MVKCKISGEKKKPRLKFYRCLMILLPISSSITISLVIVELDIDNKIVRD